jgi:ferredoxin
MNKGVAFTGVPSEEELRNSPGFPRPEDFSKGPIGVIECVQEIPCNPCELACKHGAIVVGQPITNLPRFQATLCTGCGLCIASCPGQAIFLVDATYSAEEALLTFPFEYVPLPQMGETVRAINRAGQVVCLAQVVKVQNPKAFDRTALVTISIPKAFVHEVRGIQRPRPPVR